MLLKQQNTKLGCIAFAVITEPALMIKLSGITALSIIIQLRSIKALFLTIFFGIKVVDNRNPFIMR